MTNIGLLGGSFDPPHIGHKKIINYCMKLFDKILIIPNKESIDIHKKNLASPIDRIEMLNLMFSSELIKIKDLETTSNFPSYTYNTLKFLEEKYFDDEIFMILGKDQIMNIHTWYKYEYLLSNLNIICFDRKVNFTDGFNLESTKVNIEFIKFNCDCSSTKIKKILSNYKNDKVGCIKSLSSYLDDNIISYIIENNIYTC